MLKSAGNLGWARDIKDGYGGNENPPAMVIPFSKWKKGRRQDVNRTPRPAFRSFCSSSSASVRAVVAPVDGDAVVAEGVEAQYQTSNLNGWWLVGKKVRFQ